MSSNISICKKRIAAQLSAEIPADCTRVEVIGQGGTKIIIDARPFDRAPGSVDTKSHSILIKTRKFFEDDQNYERMLAILSESATHQAISLRVLDFLVTHYARKFAVAYEHNGELLSLYSAYKSALRAYTKRAFDAFCRRDRILFVVRDKEPVLTTHAQLNFLQWIIDRGVYNYAITHQLAIESEMSSVSRGRKRARSHQHQNLLCIGIAAEVDDRESSHATSNTISNKASA